jgi:hypothetical protein
MNTTMSFTSHHIYVGLDISKPSWEVCILTEHVEHKTFTQPPSVKALVQYLKRNFPAATITACTKPVALGFGFMTNLSLKALSASSSILPMSQQQTKKLRTKTTASMLESLQGVYVPVILSLFIFLSSQTPESHPICFETSTTIYHCRPFALFRTSFSAMSADKSMMKSIGTATIKHSYE